MSASELAQRDAILSDLCGQNWPYAPLLDALSLTPEMAVLDIGAGDGGLLRELRRRGHTGPLAGIDPQPGEGVQYGVADALPFRANSFDVVIFLRVLAHLPDPAAALAEAQRVIKPAGRVVVAANGPEHLREFWRQFGREPEPAPDAKLITLPVTLSAAQASVLAQSYGLDGKNVRMDFPLRDTLQLQLDFVS